MQTVGYSTTTTTKRSRVICVQLKYIYGVGTERKIIIMYFPHYRVNMCYLVFLLPVPEDYLLPFSSRREWLFASRNMTVSFPVWLLEKGHSCRVLFCVPCPLGVTVSFPRRMVVDNFKCTYCCVTSVDFICSVPLSRIVDTSKVKG